MEALFKLYKQTVSLLETLGEPLVLLWVRLQIALFFWKSGMTKLENYLNDDWESTVELFRDFHPVPGIPADIAAPLSTLSELGFAALLVLGLMTRGAALGLLGVCGVIYITHQANLDNIGEFIEAQWLVPLILVLLVRGGGGLALDKLISMLSFKEANKPSLTE